MKKKVALLLSVVMVLAAMPMVVFGEEDTTAAPEAVEEIADEEIADEEIAEEAAEEEAAEEAPSSAISITIGADVIVLADGSEVEIDAPAYINAESGRTMLPLRAICTVLGMPDEALEWDDEAKQVTITNGDVVVVVVIGSDEMTVNDEVVELDCAAEIVSDRTFLPLRAIGEAFGAEIGWDGDTETATITPAQEEVVDAEDADAEDADAEDADAEDADAEDADAEDADAEDADAE